ncbi:SAV_6107 family HEPN domain-containing protein [Corynebacterium doosanense]|uniref:SAV-6107-like HEPN domain-containing protein n=1 Tax=Corynebacterium doosanense CAU 212 = DSM 45436 TaxID=558173 RepID=A0A097IH59_9CORY|nr:SAV_6107 family HEPN domain-containing protein [Corynebacterium doosanense]AIT61471.1 hypothetical protein CDOO_09480 [Corynebacterium doosanense CAU 212 = DSM 45436]
MGNVISATTRFGRSEGARDRFLTSAHDLIEHAQGYIEAEDWALAMESAYQAALRTAGARIASSPVIARRKRLPTSAWERLVLVDERGAEWSRELSRYSGLRSRVANGIVPRPDPAVVLALFSAARQFLAEVDAEAGWLSVA